MPRKNSFVLKRKPPSPRFQIKAVREEVRGRLKKVGDRHVKSRERVVANWSSKSRPSFRSRVTATANQVGLQVFVTEADDSKPLWKWIDETGTKPHIIRPRPSNKRGLLAFVTGGPGSYQAKTGASPARFGGPGRVTGGQLRFARQVRHPGFRARNFSKAINKDLKDSELKALKNGVAAGLRKAKRN